MHPVQTDTRIVLASRHIAQRSRPQSTNQRLSVWCPPAAALLLVVVGSGLAHTAETVEFNRDIRPILADKCFHCHGPDAASRKADLRLDQEMAARTVISPGDVAASELIARVTHADAAQRMPPSESEPGLQKDEIALLTRWVEQGAKWEQHWAFVPPSTPGLPQVKAQSWVKNSIDRFVLAKLEAAGLQPSPRATKSALIRRVTFDLTGLPPTSAEINAYMEDASPQAFERVVDRLLRSRHYGERMASVWLDAARYADSHGYSLDRRRVMWPWRDWVIAAYNQNMAFDQFAIEQIAGDLLPEATISQQVATGFNRNHPIQSEGGVINEEYRVETVVDRVETTGAVFLGLTLGCGRCHDHKYEPISQREFYEFYAFFNNVPETAHVGNRDNEADKPLVTAPSVLHDLQLQQLEALISKAAADVQAEQTGTPLKPVEVVWIDDALPERAKPFGNGGGPQEFLFVSGDDHPVHNGKRSSQRTSVGRGQHGFQDAMPLEIGAGAKLFTHVYLDPQNPPKQIMLQWHGPGGWEHRAYWGENQIPWGVDQSASRRPMGPLPKVGQWVRLEVDADAVGLKPGTKIDGWAFTQFDGSVHWDTAGVMTVPQSPAVRRLSALEVEREMLLKQKPTVMVMAEMNPRRKTFVLTRGQYDRPSKVEVTPEIPQVLGKLSRPTPDGINDRLTLARWLVSPENPLTARVTVNRFWQMFFGVGLVETPEDFGAQGAQPSHPQLLDWLATEFVKTGWDVKAMQKQIVMSATYQQSSKMTPQGLERDPKNRLLARGARFRLSAEMIRDNALAISGLLVDRIGGPSVRPYQPVGLWDDVVYGNVPRFQQDHGDKLYRRSLYTYWKRSVPPPNLQMLDAPSREACVLQRSRTNTPLAALVLMNDPTFVEAARKLAERSLTIAGSEDDARLAFMFRQATSRLPTTAELSLMEETLQRTRQRYREDPGTARKLMQVGESSFDQQLDLVEGAAFAAVANALLSLDETITKN